jgi:hypothetical protein
MSTPAKLIALQLWIDRDALARGVEDLHGGNVESFRQMIADEAGLVLNLDEDGNVCGASFEHDNMTAALDDFCSDFAPYVRAGSFIELELEDDGTRARWAFDGRECVGTETPAPRS